MTTDLDALAERRRVGCLLGAASGCVCPLSPPYEHCRKRAGADTRSTFAQLRDELDAAEVERDTLRDHRDYLDGRVRELRVQRDSLRDFVSSVAALQPGAGLSDGNLRNLIERAREALER